MPVIDGATATLQIRTGLGLNTLPIIALTAGFRVKNQAHRLNSGMNGFFAKPFDVPELISTILRHVGRSIDGGFKKPPSRS